ncbi:MAG: hormogonium polysaccharide biosynthesis protein HpsA [Cyanobacteria bacterium P01_D01_bin.105]
MSANPQTRHNKPRKPRSDFQRISRRFMSGLLRSLFFINKPVRGSQAGFVLPTTVLLLLVLTLTVGAMSFRTFSRTQSTFLAREQQVIDNVAAPAVDRAKAKLEYLFTRDTRLPGTGTPSSDVLATLVRNITSVGAGGLGISALGTDPYTLPDETRLDINDDGVADNAWSFSYDLNGDGMADDGEVIAYSLLMDDAVDPANAVGGSGTATSTRDDDIKLEDTGSANNKLKANNLVTRNGPLNTDETLSACGGSREPEQGWLPVSEAALEKNFQITAYVSNGKDLGRANSAIELQQVRRALRGNRWGAWFKNDIEIHPGPIFNWNGAIHSEGNIMLTNRYRGHMVSSHNSCLYEEDSSQLTMAQHDNNTDGTIDVDSGDFQGQLIHGASSYGAYGQAGDITDIHIFTSDNAKPKLLEDNTTKLTTSNDSITNKSGQSLDEPTELAVDPVALFSQDVHRHRTTTSWKRADAWDTNAYNTGNRVVNEEVRAPYLDDFYRADNRYGPQPAYDTTNWVNDSDDGTDKSDASTYRSDAAYDKSLGEDILNSDPNGDNLLNTISGLDGYWERQSIQNGMRVVVGQRLELGDSNGWNYDATADAVGSNTDPIYPPNSLGSTENKQKQRVTLRDNLAAVQGMVVYHYESNSGTYPLACIANTAHPGTFQTLVDSRTFSNYASSSGLKTDFFNGQGTNGWEFSFPSAFDTESEFGTQVGSINSLGIALRNLAYFAGDPQGGAPSFTPVQEANGSTVVHPFPYQAMWGDFSTLRRIFDEYLDNSVAYASLSPADQSTLHSAACTLGLLAYNMDALRAEANQIIGDHLSDIVTAIDADLSALQAMTTISARIDEIDSRATSFTFSNDEKIVLELFRQVARDRTAGFLSDTALVSGTTVCSDVDFKGVPSITSAQQTSLANAFCAKADEEASQYPSLYYLFPKASHGQVGGGSYTQPSTEDYINQSYLTDSTNGVNRSALVNYEVVGDDGATADVEDASDTGIAAIAFTPKAATVLSSSLSTWVLPTTVDSNVSNDPVNPETMEIELPDGQLASLAMLDKVMYNGREEMAVRVLDIDLAKLTQNTNSTDYWVSDDKESVSGVLYAAREDAVREDSIVRPTADTWANCDSLTELVSSACRMDTSSTTPEDPPLSRRSDGTFVGISLKPIDFAPDPDRRPYGFRLNADLGTNNGDLSNNFARDWGFTFVSDNAAYVKGEFNPHTTNGTDTIEEFDETLLDGSVDYGADFYDARTTLNTDQFATDTADRWRVAEILADAVSILSPEFVDGSVEEGFIRGLGETSTEFTNAFGNASVTSFHNQQRPLQNSSGRFGFAGKWLRIDGIYPSYDGTGWTRSGSTGGPSYAVPIWVGRNGESRLQDEKSSGRFFRTFDDAEGNSFFDANTQAYTAGDVVSGNDFQQPSERSGNGADLIRVTPALAPRVNTTIISGLVPSRRGQGYGGLHNFPRFQERWEQDDNNGTALYIQGSFLQLNFSTASTGPFDADSWDPGQTGSTSSQNIGYYDPPDRRWGYDVALQYVTAGPIAQRFVTIQRPRSEHYREIPIEDPYVTNLRCAKKEDSGSTWVQIFSTEDCS